MNQLSPFVDQVLRRYSHTALEKMFNYLAENPGDKDTDSFQCGLNQMYVVKRLITTTLARDGNIKFNAYFALSTLLTFASHLKESINVESLQRFIFNETDIKENCGGKFSEIQAYVSGKILIFKALKVFFVDNLIIINHLSQLFGENTEFQEQIIDLLRELVKGKKAQLAFNKLNPQTKTGFVLYSIFKSQLKEEKMELNTGVIDDVLEELAEQYPKRSLCIEHLGVQMRQTIKKPRKYLTEKLQNVLHKEEGQEVNVKKLFYLLQLLESYLSNLQITKENVWKVLTIKMLENWFSQMKVQNKYIKRQVQNIQLHFEEDEDMAFDILEELHKENINISNMNNKHPLYPLLLIVQPEKYFNHLIELCTTEYEIMEDENESKKVPPLNELEVFVAVAHKKLKAQSVTKAIQLLVYQYKESKDEKDLQNISRMFNSIFPDSHKKRRQICLKQSQILSKINFQHLELGQFENQIKTAFKDTRLLIKENKQEENPLILDYLNFMVCVGFYLIIHPEEVQVFEDIKKAFEDIKKNYLTHEQKLEPKKKRKLNEQEKSKPIHILVDVLISLLTKSPLFLRNSINNLFEQIIPFVDGEDLGHLFEVIQKPDQEFMEQINE